MSKQVDVAEATKALALILEPGQVTELRSLFATTNGKRCHGCVVELGQLAAPLLRGPLFRAGRDSVEVAAELDYPSAEGIMKLAVVHGGYGQPRLKRWLHTVAATVRDIFHGTEDGHGK